MVRTATVLCAPLGAAAAAAQGRTNEQATEEGRQKNAQFARDGALTARVHTAAEVARRVRGVSEVTNELRVKGG